MACSQGRGGFLRYWGPLICVLALPMASLAQANGRRSRFDLFLEGGGSFMTPKTTSQITGYSTSLFGPTVARETVTLQNSGRLFAGADFWFTQHDAIQASYAYNSADMTESTENLDPPVPGGWVGFIERAHTLSFDYMHSFQAGSRWQVLVMAGIGRIWRTPLAPGSFVSNLGAGAEFSLTRHWGIRAEYRDFMMPYPTAGFVGGMANNHAPTIGLVYHF
jgi:hypothetical protein